MKTINNAGCQPGCYDLKVITLIFIRNEKAC